MAATVYEGAGKVNLEQATKGGLGPELELELADSPTLFELADRVYAVRVSMLCAGSDGLADIAEQHVMLAFAALESATAQLKLAAIHQARALAECR